MVLPLKRRYFYSQIATVVKHFQDGIYKLHILINLNIHDRGCFTSGHTRISVVVSPLVDFYGIISHAKHPSSGNSSPHPFLAPALLSGMSKCRSISAFSAEKLVARIEDALFFETGIPTDAPASPSLLPNNGRADRQSIRRVFPPRAW